MTRPALSHFAITKGPSINTFAIWMWRTTHACRVGIPADARFARLNTCREESRHGTHKCVRHHLQSKHSGNVIFLTSAKRARN